MFVVIENPGKKIFCAEQMVSYCASWQDAISIAREISLDEGKNATIYKACANFEAQDELIDMDYYNGVRASQDYPASLFCSSFNQQKILQ